MSFLEKWTTLKSNLSVHSIVKQPTMAKRISPSWLSCGPHLYQPLPATLYNNLDFSHYLYYSAQTATAKYHRLDGFNKRLLFLTVVEAGMSKMKVPARLVLFQDPLSWFVSGCHLPVCSHDIYIYLVYVWGESEQTL